MRNTRLRVSAGRARQRGQAIIALLLVFVTGMSFMLLRDINQNLRQADRALETARVLAEAKRAILGYAAAYPDRVNATRGPGRLPCPERATAAAGVGIAGGSCSDGGGTTFGRLPWKTLDMNRGEDSSGHALWYAISENYRNNPPVTPLNSETSGQLQVDAASDIVAVIIAPGEPLASQYGRSSNPTAAGYLDITQYLDGENANGDATFTMAGNAPFNDRLVFITRDEVMDLAERRVAGEVHRILREYQADWNAFPWLAGWAPGGSDFQGTAPLNEGHLPFHVFDQPFPTTFQMTWQVLSTEIVVRSGTVEETDLREQTVPLDFTGPGCTWRGVRAVHACSGQTVQVLSGPERTRTIDVNVTFTGTSHTVAPPTATAIRTRAVSSAGALPAGSTITIAMRDVDESTPPVEVGTGSATFSGSTVTTVTVSGIAYDLNPDGDGAGDGPSEIVEVPAWFYTDQWHRMTLVSYPDAAAEAVPGGAISCTPGTDCLAVCSPGLDCPPDTPTLQNVRALVAVSGREREGEGQTRPGTALTDYFESENANPGRTAFERPSAASNDRLRIIATAP